jgi:hypothetical protein
MFAYDFLKENPQVRDSLIKHEWYKLMTDDSVSYSVKKELSDMQKAGIKITDAALFFYKAYLLEKEFNGKRISKQPTYCFNSKIAEYIYSTPRLSNDTKNHWFMSLSDAIIGAYIDIDIFNKMISAGDRSETLSAKYVWALSGCRVQGIDAVQFVMKCAHTLIKRLDVDQIQTVLQLLHDVAPPGNKFKSINEIARAHDERTAVETERLLSEVGDVSYIYTNELQALCKEYKLILPTGPVALVKRGQEHHNCVATYDRKHREHIEYTDEKTRSIVRLFFTTNATIEMYFWYNSEGIISTRINQCKGVFNREIEPSLLVSRFQRAVVGHSVDILKVTVRSDK